MAGKFDVLAGETPRSSRLSRRHHMFQLVDHVCPHVIIMHHRVFDFGRKLRSSILAVVLKNPDSSACNKESNPVSSHPWPYFLLTILRGPELIVFFIAWSGEDAVHKKPAGGSKADFNLFAMGRFPNYIHHTFLGEDCFKETFPKGLDVFEIWGVAASMVEFGKLWELIHHVVESP